MENFHYKKITKYIFFYGIPFYIPQSPEEKGNCKAPADVLSSGSAHPSSWPDQKER